MTAEGGQAGQKNDSGLEKAARLPLARTGTVQGRMHHLHRWLSHI